MGTRVKRRRQQGLFYAADLAEAPGHPFYKRLNEALDAADFDGFCEERCWTFYHDRLGRPSLAPGVYFRLQLIGFFEGVNSERGIAWRVADSLSLRCFLGYGLDEATPDHVTLLRTRRLLDAETHQAIFSWVLERLAAAGLLKGKTIGVDATTLEADAAMRSIVRRATGENYREYLAKLAAADGEASDRAALQRRDRKRKKKVSNKDWVNPHDREAEITKMKDGRTRLAYKAEQAVDLDTGAIVATTAHPGASGDIREPAESAGRAGQALVAPAGREAGEAVCTPVRDGRDAAVTSAWAGRSEKETTAPSGGVQSGAAAADQAWCGNAARSGRGRKKALRRDFGAVGGPPSTCGSRQRADRTTRPAGPGPIPPPELMPPALRSGGLDTGC